MPITGKAPTDRPGRLPGCCGGSRKSPRSTGCVTPPATGLRDGRDVSWVWDADWEVLAPQLRSMTCSGTRAAELALRLKYAGADPGRLHVVEDVEEGLDAALADGDGPLYALPTYTALLELRELLARRGAAKEYWR